MNETKTNKKDALIPSSLHDLTVVVDGNNVAFDEQDEQGRPRLRNILAMRQALQMYGCKQVIIFISAQLKYTIDQPALLKDLIAHQVVRQTPASSHDDKFIVHTAQAFQAWIVSNDQFRDFSLAEQAWIQQRQLKFSVINGLIIFETLSPCYSFPSADISPDHWQCIRKVLETTFQEVATPHLPFTALKKALGTAKKAGHLPLSHRLIVQALRHLINVGYLIPQADGKFSLQADNKLTGDVLENWSVNYSVG